MLEDSALSRDHFLIEINPPRCEIRDLGSTNGTFVNERRVERVFASLQNGALPSAFVRRDGRELMVRVVDEPRMVERREHARDHLGPFALEVVLIVDR